MHPKRPKLIMFIGLGIGLGAILSAAGCAGFEPWAPAAETSVASVPREAPPPPHYVFEGSAQGWDRPWYRQRGLEAPTGADSLSNQDRASPSPHPPAETAEAPFRLTPKAETQPPATTASPDAPAPGSAPQPVTQ